MVVFNSTLFNKAIFNTKFIASGGVSKRRFKKLPKQLMEGSAVLKVSSGLIIPVYLKAEGKILTGFNSKVESKISYPDSIVTSSKILREVYKPIHSVVSSVGDITVKGKLNNVELKLNKFFKSHTVVNQLLLLDI
tara:strand:- start:337 stop:741 length:405 start_codon:yes stop_codon:yes gene_type:complete